MPLASFSPELLERVFDAMLFREGEWAVDECHRRAVRAVCRPWSNIVDTKSRYWDCIEIAPYSSPEYILFCLAKSSTRPLRLLICIAHPAWIVADSTGTLVSIAARKTFAEFRHALLDIVTPVFHRVSHLDARCVSHAQWHSLFVDLGSLDAPLLTKLTASVSPPYPRPAVLPVETATAVAVVPSFPFVHAPLLSAVALNFTKMPLSPALFSQLQTLCLCRVTASLGQSWDALRYALSSAPHLRQLELQGIECDGYGDRSTLVLPNLTHLLLGTVSDVHDSLFPLIAAPSLVVLCLDFYSSTSVACFTRDCTHLLRVATTLELNLYDETDDDEAIPMFRSMSRLEVADFRRGSSSLCFEVVDAMTLDQQMLPMLRLMKVDMVLNDCEVDEVLNCIAQRCGVGKAAVVYVDADAGSDLGYVASSLTVTGAVRETYVDEAATWNQSF